jgi:hypothetical protein
LEQLENPFQTSELKRAKTVVVQEPGVHKNKTPSTTSEEPGVHKNKTTSATSATIEATTTICFKQTSV